MLADTVAVSVVFSFCYAAHKWPIKSLQADLTNQGSVFVFFTRRPGLFYYYFYNYLSKDN